MTDNKVDQQLDTNGTPAEPQAGEQKISANAQKDELGDNSLDAVSGGTWPFNSLARASYAAAGPGG
jgi:hypothetical protein